MSDRNGYVYIIAFDRPMRRVMMVKNIKRGGWEMPGGGIHPGESPEDAAHREFIEETGHEFIIHAQTREEDGGYVFYGFIGGKIGDFRPHEISQAQTFEQLPPDDELNWPQVEYEELIQRGRTLVPHS